MQNNTPFSRDPTPDLTRTILSVVKEGLLGKLKKKAKRFTQGLTTGGDGPPSPGEELMNARWARGHRTEGDIQRAYMKHKARATVKEEYIELLESALESIAEELECSVEDLLEDLPPKSHVDRITKKTMDARLAQLSPEQRAAAMKDRNSGIHRTPAELKAHDAGMKAYVKSRNNRTDSKGKKLDPYDDYQS